MQGWLRALLLLPFFLTLAVPGASGDDKTPAETASGGPAVQLEIQGAIGPVAADYLRRGFAVAADREAPAVILRIDTPGGLESSVRDIIRDILALDIPVIAYVGPGGARAASAGTYIVYASHFAAMAPGTHLGAATPVAVGGFPESDKKGNEKRAAGPGSREKSINDAVAYIQGLATMRDRNADWAERAVREAATLTASDALKHGVIEAVSPNVDDAMVQANGATVQLPTGSRDLQTAGVSVEVIEPNWRERALAVITNPSIAYILLLVGIYGLILEALTPGTIGPGVVGAIALLTSAYALNLLPISFTGVALLLFGITLMVTEALLPSFGIMGVGGTAAFALGSLLLFEGEASGFTLSWQLIALSTAASAAFLIVALRVAWRAHGRAVATGGRALVGSPGLVVTWLDREGHVHVQGEQWRARANQPLSAGQNVRVIGRTDLTLLVEPEPSMPPQL